MRQSAAHLTAVILPLLPKRTRRNQSELVFLICDLLLLNISSREEKPHHPLEELVHQLDGERHHVHLTMGHNTASIKHDPKVSVNVAARDVSSPQSAP